MDIKTGNQVKWITSNKKNIEAGTTKVKYTCEKLIIAVPVGVLQCNKRHASYIDFPPSMKKYIDAARSIGNGGVIKFLLESDNAFWL